MLTALLALLLVGGPDAGVATAPAEDGPNARFEDPLLDRMVGEWLLKGQVRGEPATNELRVSWVLNHQFLQLQLRQPDPVDAGDVRYEAWVMVGKNHGDGRLVAHWVDVFGGKASETLGFGRVKGNAIELSFAYPDGTFHDSFAVLPDGTLHFRITTVDARGKPVVFAEYRGHKARK